jgi:hypothetical protein
MIGPWLTAPACTFRAIRQDARGLRARGAVALLGGLCAERRAVE